MAPPGTLLRLGDPRIQPLEIWRLLLDSGAPLWRVAQRRPERLLEGLDLLHRGAGRTRDGRTDHHTCAGYQHLVIGGGRAAVVPDDLLRRGPTPFTRLTDPVVAEAGGHALAARLGFRPAEVLVLDLGQTAIKASHAGRRCRLERDLDRLPRGRLPERRRAEQRQALCAWLAEAITAVVPPQDKPLAVIFALPGEITADGMPGRTTYMGTQDHRSLLPDVLRRAGLSPKVVGVLNDAELAACSASLLPEAAGKTLVLTLGFGLGAALLAETRSPPP